MGRHTVDSNLARSTMQEDGMLRFIEGEDNGESAAHDGSYMVPGFTHGRRSIFFPVLVRGQAVPWCLQYVSAALTIVWDQGP